MMAYYEKALREECGYDGAQPYWDWLIDTESGLNMTQWPIFDPDTGFGGDGPFIATTDDENPLGIEGREGGSYWLPLHKIRPITPTDDAFNRWMCSRRSLRGRKFLALSRAQCQLHNQQPALPYP
jgi:hypothetical protein